MSSLFLDFLLLLALINIFLSFRAFHQCKSCKNAYGETKFLHPLGMYVWGDTLIFSIFWSGVSLVCFYLQDFLLFLLTFFLFHFVRNAGETFYWLNQQFYEHNRNNPKNYSGHTLFPGNSIWSLMQMKNQCVAILTFVIVVYLATLWLQTI